MMNLVGRTLGPYKLEAPLGKGGMAAVYRAYQASVKRYVAVKVMATEIANEPGFVERFEREAQVIASLEHPHILPVIDYGDADGVHYIVMRYMDGGSLADLMREKPLTLAECAQFLNQVASALDYAHRHGVVHRDLKPNNVLMDKDHNCYLTDFGIARLQDSERKLTATGSVMGTPSYMSPEQALGRPVDGRSDIYTLGVMLYEMVVGQLPFAADTPAALIFQHVYEQPIPAQQIKPEIPPTVAAVIDRALAKSPDARYQTATDMANAFAEAVGTKTQTGLPTPSRIDSEPTLVGDAGAFTPAGITPPSAIPRATPPTSRGQTPAALTQPGDYVTPQKKSSSSLILAGLFVVILLLGGGVVLILSRGGGDNTAQTQTAQAIGQTQTAQVVVILALSYTPTHTPTMTLTPSLTPTHTPSLTPTHTPTRTLAYTPTRTLTHTPTRTLTHTASPTIDVTGTALAGQLATINAFSANQTAMARAGLSGSATAVKEQILKNYIARETLQAGATATTLANQLATVNAFNANMTATSLALTVIPTDTPVFSPLETISAQATLTAQAKQPGITPTKSTMYRLLSKDPTEIVETLRGYNLIPADSRAIEVPLQQDDPYIMTGKVEDTNTFYPSLFSRGQLYDFVFSADITVTSSTAAVEKTYCGVFMNGQNEDYSGVNLLDIDMLVFYYTRLGKYRLDARKNGDWGAEPILADHTGAILETAPSNRLTAIMINKTLSIYINAVKVFSSDQDYTGGMIGFFMIKGAAGSKERCTFSDIRVWRLN